TRLSMSHRVGGSIQVVPRALPRPESSFSLMRKTIRRVLQLQGKAWSIVARSALLPVTSLVSTSERRRLWMMEAVRQELADRHLYPEVALSEIVGRETAVRVLEIPSRTFNVDEVELLAIAALTSQARPSLAFELGTADGRTTRNFAANM